MREIEKALLLQIQRQQQDMYGLFNAAVAATETRRREPLPVDVRIYALEEAVRARGPGITDDALVETAKQFEQFLLGNKD
jgi:hypothetical protein